MRISTFNHASDLVIKGKVSIDEITNNAIYFKISDGEYSADVAWDKSGVISCSCKGEVFDKFCVHKKATIMFWHHIRIKQNK